MKPEHRLIGVLGGLGLVLLGVSLRSSRPQFRPWELVKQRDGFLFQPGRRVEMDEIGDLGYKSWVRALQHPRHVTFTTDSRGFRNPREMQRPEVVVLGDSYVVGVGVSDRDTLSEQLSARLGVDVYNYGLGIGGTPQLFLADDRFQRSPPRLLIYAPVQRMLRPRPLLLPGGRWPDRKPAPGLARRWAALDESVEAFFAGLNRDNGLAVLARYGWGGLRYRLFGWPSTIVVDGTRVLVLTIEEQSLDVPASERDPGGAVRSLVDLHALLARRGIELLFCPIFEAATIYADLYPPEARARIQRPSLLDVVIGEARRNGVRTVDLRPGFRLQRFPYLFLSDDSHWNPRAIGLAAEAIIRAMRSGRPP
jgi:SGNH hydrolase-like domain, acetyltransferase AlgX